MSAFVRLLAYLWTGAATGALAHWLWIGDRFDPHNVLAWVCLLLGPFMLTLWALKSVCLLFAVRFATGALFAFCWMQDALYR